MTKPSAHIFISTKLSDPKSIYIYILEKCQTAAAVEIRASKCHGRATAQYFAEFAQNLGMCTPKLEKTCIFSIFTCFLHILTPFM